jgi:urease accessory protein UreF
MGGSATAVGVSGASGGGSNVMRNTDLLTSYQAILSTQATGGGAHLSHVGTFRVYARVEADVSNTGDVTIAWEWGEGDFSRSTLQNETVLSPTINVTWKLVDLGLVTLRPVANGTQKWEGRLVAKSTVTGDQIDVDYLMFVPIGEGSGIASGVLRDVTPSSYSARDQFVGTTSGNALNARVAPTGGTWATSGDATDFAFADTFAGETYENVSRATGTVTNGRYAILGSTNYTDTRLEARVSRTGTPTVGQQLTMALIARWTDSSNYLRAQVMVPSDQALSTLEIRMILAGTSTTLASTLIPYTFGVTSSNLANLLRFTVLSSGLAIAQLWNPAQTAVVASCSAQNASLATGATLATGKPGLWDFSSSAHERHYSDFFLSVPPADAALFGSQSLEVRHDRVVHEDSAGAIWSTVSNYEGDYLKVPPAGAEARTLRAIVKATRGEPDEFDAAIDDISARLFVTPRFLVVPDA